MVPGVLAATFLSLTLGQSPAESRSGEASRSAAPRRVKVVEPSYPKEAARAGLAGDVVVECSIDADGRVRGVELVSGVSPLTDAAIEAVRKWRYEPALVEGVATPFVTKVTLSFRAPKVLYSDLLDSLDSRNEHVREAAARNLGELRPTYGIRKGEIPRAARTLEKLAEQDGSPLVRAAAASSAARLTGRPVEPKPEPEPENAQGDYDPRPVHMPKPNYPLQAFQEGIEGTVLVEILIDAEGRVARSRVVESVPGLDEAALAAVREWRFIPARKEGKAVPALAHVPVSFKIGADKK
jgi:TonB family protein